MFKDFIAAFKSKDLWIYLGWFDVLSKYRRTTLGPLWSIVMTGISILCMSVVGSLLFKANIRDFFPHVACGMITWGYLSAIIAESCTTFTSYSNIIQNVKLPLISFVLRAFVRNTIIFAHSLVILLIVLIVFNKMSWSIFYIIPALAVYFVNAISMGIILGFFSTRYRDVSYIVLSLLNILVLLTPIMWRKEMLGEHEYLANFNPITHFIEIIRAPLLGNEISNISIYYCFAITVALWLFASYLYKNFKNRLVFWL